MKNQLYINMPFLNFVFLITFFLEIIMYVWNFFMQIFVVNIILCSTFSSLRFLGLLTCFITKPIPGIVYPPETETPLESFVKLILFHLSYKSALQRLAVSLVLSEWAKCENGVSCKVIIFFSNKFIYSSASFNMFM